MRNPLNYRLIRDLKQDMAKYMVLFLFLVITIGFVSGFLVADSSMKTAYDNSFEKYNIEDGHFTLSTEADEKLIQRFEDENISVFELFYKELTLENENTIRIYKNRDKVNKVCLMNGEFPKKENEIAIDRLYGENNKISINDIIKMNDKSYIVTGLVSLSDYSALFKSNSDMMLDANRFCVAVVSESAFDKISDDKKNYCYAWLNNNKNLTDNEHSKKGDDLLEVLKSSKVLTDFVKRENNSAINYTGDDMGSDKSMIIYLLYVVIVVLAFVFAVTTKSTMEKEASIIGTLRASGYTKIELLKHYLALPTLTTLMAAIIGNIIGYTFMKNVVVGMYYNSYSLPTYITIWNGEAFILTTVIPWIIILLVNLVVLWSTLSLSPLQFLRHDLKRKKKNRVAKLPAWKFTTRFRMRIILQNLSAYITMFVGIAFASIVMIFGFIMSPMLSNFKEEVKKSQIADYQYILKAPVETENKSAEKYSVTSLKIPGGDKITVYGIKSDSQYLRQLKLPKGENQIIISNGYMDKYGIKVGDKVTLEKEYEDKSYTFTVIDSYQYAGALSVFMPQENYNEIFDYEGSYFTGYFSNKKLDDIDEACIASVITKDDLTVIADQLDDSMGAMFTMVCGFSTFMYILMMYLLAKLIVEKNTQCISMIKILGYNHREAGKLYNMATAVVVFISLILSLPISYIAMKGLYYEFMKKSNGWFTFYMAPWICPAMVGIGIVCYSVVHVIQMKKIGKISMAQALKNVE